MVVATTQSPALGDFLYTGRRLYGPPTRILNTSVYIAGMKRNNSGFLITIHLYG